jgi:hypothetical protein
MILEDALEELVGEEVKWSKTIRKESRERIHWNRHSIIIHSQKIQDSGM